jgi:hypothetical protein
VTETESTEDIAYEVAVEVELTSDLLVSESCVVELSDPAIPSFASSTSLLDCIPCSLPFSFTFGPSLPLLLSTSLSVFHLLDREAHVLLQISKSISDNGWPAWPSFARSDKWSAGHAGPPANVRPGGPVRSM